METVAWSAIGLLAAGMFGMFTLFFHLGSKSDVLASRVDALGSRLDARIEAQGARLEARIDGLANRLDARLDSQGNRLDALFERLELHIEHHSG